jgi:protein-tyrosine phosphatase
MNILMVCLGNICRSPLAEGILRSKVEKLNITCVIDSAGTSGHHIGEKPDARMRATALSYGISLEDLRARQFVVADFDQFDIIYVMDSSNYSTICSLARNESDKQKVKLILNELDPGKNLAVPDPYYGGQQGFVDVYNLLDQASDKIIEKLN